MLDVGDEETQRCQHSWHGGHNHLADGKGARDHPAMHGAGPAKDDQREIAGVMLAGRALGIGRLIKRTLVSVFDGCADPGIPWELFSTSCFKVTNGMGNPSLTENRSAATLSRFLKGKNPAPQAAGVANSYP